MRLLDVRYLKNTGPFAASPAAQQIRREIESAIAGVYWPLGSNSFTLHEQRQGNGVKPIKDHFIGYLRSENWIVEHRLALSARLQPGKVDAVRTLTDGRMFAVEWETGNISSSHRALNKIALGMLDGRVAGGALILPSGDMYRYLTDRVGNYPEIAPYFPMWEALPIDGVLAVYVVEHDALSSLVPLIAKGTDGRARI